MVFFCVILEIQVMLLSRLRSLFLNFIGHLPSFSLRLCNLISIGYELLIIFSLLLLPESDPAVCCLVLSL